MDSPVSASGPWLKLHHVGFVVAHLDAAVGRFTEALSASWDGRIVHDPIQRVNVTFLTPVCPSEAQVELIEPAGPEAPVTKFLSRNGGGLHHLCYEVPELESQLLRSKSQGALIVQNPVPAVAFDGRRIAWVYTRDKLLLEFLEAVKQR